MSYPLALLNTTIATTDGDYHIRTISLNEARVLFANAKSIDSAIGHESTASVMSTLLGGSVPMNRQDFAQAVGQTALVLKLNGRAPEGKILSISEIEEMGYTFKAMIRTA